MSQPLNDIKKPISNELDEFEFRFKNAMKSDVALLDKVTSYIVKRKGKQIRPMFVFLAAKICGELGDATYDGASLVEMLHTATLVHDDVVDDSIERRGFFSVNALWKNKIAVLVGDYLLAKGLSLAVKNNHFTSLQILSNAVQEMSEGELLQMEKARRLDIKESVYFDIITKKTASLIASACAIGAASVSEDKKLIARMHKLGETIGIAFQIKDDLFDYGDDEVGKPRGIDIKERKMTLPLIYSLNNATAKEKNKIINIVKNENENNDKVKEVIDFVKRGKGIGYTKDKMMYYRDEAIKILNTFEPSPARESLGSLLDYTIKRNF